MHEMSRKVRFSPGTAEANGRNGFGGSPRHLGLNRFDEFEVVCRGRVDPQTSYLIDIKQVDRAVAQAVLPAVSQAVLSSHPDPASVMRGFLEELNKGVGGILKSVRWNLTPTFRLEMEVLDMEHVVIRQRFDFAAAHRLHNPRLSDEDNRRLYGKCNNPSGHGHNYQFEPAVRVPVGAMGLGLFSLEVLEQVSSDVILDRFDHRHLNEDTVEFRQPDGVNPSVENIAMVFYRLLGPEIQRRCPSATLVSMTVWETDRTCSTYPA